MELIVALLPFVLGGAAALLGLALLVQEEALGLRRWMTREGSHRAIVTGTFCRASAIAVLIGIGLIWNIHYLERSTVQEGVAASSAPAVSPDVVPAIVNIECDLPDIPPPKVMSDELARFLLSCGQLSQDAARFIEARPTSVSQASGSQGGASPLKGATGKLTAPWWLLPSGLTALSLGILSVLFGMVSLSTEVLRTLDKRRHEALLRELRRQQLLASKQNEASNIQIDRVMRSVRELEGDMAGPICTLIELLHRTLCNDSKKIQQPSSSQLPPPDARISNIPPGAAEGLHRLATCLSEAAVKRELSLPEQAIPQVRKALRQLMQLPTPEGSSAARDLGRRLPGNADRQLAALERSLAEGTLTDCITAIEALTRFSQQPTLGALELTRALAGLAVSAWEADGKRIADYSRMAQVILNPYEITMQVPRVGERFDTGRHYRKTVEHGSGYSNRHIARVIRPGFSRDGKVYEKAEVAIGG